MTQHPDTPPTSPTFQTNIQGDVSTSGGTFNTGTIDTGGGDFINKQIILRYDDGPETLPATTRAGLEEYLHAVIRHCATLGASPAADITPGIRQQVVTALAAALRHDASHRPVWLLKGDTIEQEGTFDQHLYTALLRVEGFTR